MTSYVAPVMDGSTFRGIAGADVALNDVQTQINRIKILQHGYSMLVTGKGAYLAAPKKGLVGKSTLAKLKRSDLGGHARVDRARRLGQLIVKDPFGSERAIVSWAPVSDRRLVAGDGRAGVRGDGAGPVAAQQAADHGRDRVVVGLGWPGARRHAPGRAAARLRRPDALGRRARRAGAGVRHGRDRVAAT